MHMRMYWYINYTNCLVYMHNLLAVSQVMYEHVVKAIYDQVAYVRN